VGLSPRLFLQRDVASLRAFPLFLISHPLSLPLSFPAEFFALGANNLLLFFSVPRTKLQISLSPFPPPFPQIFPFFPSS